METFKIAATLTLLIAALAPQAGAQNFDSSGNNLLQGTYYFRNVVWVVGDSSGDLGQVLAAYGNISFDGNGNYSITCNTSNAGNCPTQVFEADSNGESLGALCPAANPNPPCTVTGTYTISASGFGFISHPLSTGDYIYGLISHGIFVGSATESGFNDLFIAAPLPSPAPTNASFSGSYSFLSLDSPDGTPSDDIETSFQLNPNGSGSLGTVTVNGFVGGQGTQEFSENIGGVKYFFSNGAANLNFNGTEGSDLIAGTKYLYFSPDGNFVFGGSPIGVDMIIGVKNGGASPNFSGLYYAAGMYQNETDLASGFADLDSYYGSLRAINGDVLGHQRLQSLFNNNPLDYTYATSFSLSGNTYSDGFENYIFGAGGMYRIGFGVPPIIGVDVAVQGPTFTGSGVYIDPTGVVNAASSSLFTAGIAPGELITIYGSNLAPSLKVDGTFPTTLNGVNVEINNVPAPIYFVSPNQISAVVPFETTQLLADIQVFNNGVGSNIVSTYTNLTSPGVFTSPAGGIGSAAALHSDFSLISATSPAQIGETILLFVTGLGAVSPPVADAAPGGTSTLNEATNTIGVYIDGQPATVTYAGLAPGLIGLDQINAEVPSGVSSGNVNLDVAGPDSYTSEAYLPVGSVASTTPAARRPVPHTSQARAAHKFCGLHGCESTRRRTPFGVAQQ